MKKFALFTIMMAFVFGMNAQTISIGNESFNMGPKMKAHAVIPASKMEKKSFEKVGWVSSVSYLNYLLPSSYSLTRTMYTLFPDSCLFDCTNQLGKYTANPTWMHAIGHSVDPYSESYDKMFMNGIFPTPSADPVTTYPYSIDSIFTQCVYYWGDKDGYNAASPDTLRFYVSYHNVYQWDNGRSSEWVALHYTSDEAGDTALFSPLVRIDSNVLFQSKGTALYPKAASCKTFDYILSESDSTYYWDSVGVDGDTSTWYRYTNITVPAGYEVPAGAVVSIICKFIPGYEYNLGDSLMYGEVDANNYYKHGYPRYGHNCFRISGYYESKDGKAFCDPYGYNFNFFEHMNGRYQMWMSNGAPNKLYNSMYYPTAQHLPFMQYLVSYDSLGAVDVVDSNLHIGINEAENIIEAVYPNPANDYVTVELKNNDRAVIRIYNVMGQAVKSVVTNEIKNNISTQELSAGMYIISVEQNGKRFNTKLSVR